MLQAHDGNRLAVPICLLCLVFILAAIQQDLSGSGGHDTGNELGEGGFTAAIGASDDHEFIIPDCEIDMLEDLLAVRQCITYIFEFQHAEHLLNRI